MPTSPTTVGLFACSTPYGIRGWCRPSGWRVRIVGITVLNALRHQRMVHVQVACGCPLEALVLNALRHQRMVQIEEIARIFRVPLVLNALRHQRMVQVWRMRRLHRR